jgi:RNA ligase (TIGR02306 family)
MVAENVNLIKFDRKLVTIRRVKEILPIPGADAIEVAAIDGWKVVVKKGEFKAGDLCVYFEIDSFLPESDPRYAFLMKSGVREFDGVRGHKLRTVRRLGQISQGLALPLGHANDTLFPEIWKYLLVDNLDVASPYEADYSELLGIKKWEPQVPAELAGQVKGSFPSFIRKTDQPRCQNLINEIFIENAGARYEVSMKLDGSSCTIYIRDGELGVCSRNLELKINEENKNNALVRAMYDNLLNISLPTLNRNIALQGELMGPGIQGNHEQLKKTQFFVFDIFDIDTGDYVSPADRYAILEKLRSFCPQLQHVPVIYKDVSLEELGINSVDGLLKLAEGPSINHAVREGLVFKRHDGRFSFKAISNLFLSKEKD